MKIIKNSVADVNKVLIELDDKNLVESVLIENKNTSTICVSSQVGCSVGCLFCASGNKFKRNLTIDEMLFQLDYFSNISKNKQKIVFMGMGEPFLNYDNVLECIKILCVQRKNRISKQDITVSTSGLCDKIKQFSDDSLLLGDVPVNLAISLHFISDEKRKKYMPNLSSKNTISNIIESCKYYLSKSKNAKLMIEYLLLKNINDSLSDAQKLCQILEKVNCVINLIEYNYTNCNNKIIFEKSDNLEMFKKFIISKGYKCFIRKSHGKKIDAACGMLVNQNEKNDCCK